MFLRPQHFQQHELFIDARFAEYLRLNQTHPWGVRKVQLDKDSLGAGLLRLSALAVVFPDGTVVDAPAAEPLPTARNLNDIPGLKAEAIVYACLPDMNAFGGNSAEPDVHGGRVTRFVTERAMVSDLHTNALQAEVTALRANVRLLLETENRDGHYGIPVLRLLKNATGVWTMDENYIPPLVAVAGSAQLQLIVRRLLDILMVKSQALAASHRERVKHAVEYGTSDIASFWLLHTVNRAFPTLNHIARYTGSHPEGLYITLAQLAGELLTFSSTHTLNGIPPYIHQNLTATFSALDALIRELLDTVISSRFAIVPLTNPRPSFYIGRLESERLLENVDFYLSVSSDQPMREVLDAVPLKLKIGAPDDVEKILSSALPGVRLIHAAQTPAAIPVRVGNHYFALEPHGVMFERMLKSRSVCIYVPQALPGLNFELIAVFR